MAGTTIFWGLASGIVAGVLANVLTPLIARALGKYSSIIRVRNEKRRVIFDSSVQYLLEHPLDEINLRIAFSWNLLCFLSLVLFSLLTTASANLVYLILALIAGIGSLYFVARLSKLARLIQATWRKRKPTQPEIDIE